MKRMLTLRVEEPFIDRLADAAAHVGLSRSNFMRTVLGAAARSLLTPGGPEFVAPAILAGAGRAVARAARRKGR